MSSTSFANISTQFGIYVGLPLFTFGILGNLINLCLLFPTQSNPTSFLLFVSSLFNLLALSVGLLPRVLTVGFNIDGTLTILIWCKTRIFLSYIGILTSLTCICFASIDRYFVSCRSVTWRNRSKVSTGKIAIFIAILIIISINVPYILFNTIIQMQTTTKCSVINSNLVFYGNYFVRPILFSVIPGTVLSITGWFTYRNLTSIVGIQVRGTFQRSLTSMLLLQIIVVIIPIIPFAVMNIYQVITASVVKTSYRTAQEALVLDITNIIFYTGNASNFYVYFISASSYRRDFVRFVLFCYSGDHWNNRIIPATVGRHEMNETSMRTQLPRLHNKVHDQNIV
ncbi:unnamed protein product [Adineta steineri]|uniref:G-protein coupled receptors family 1 profile domain-containing protein n=1 Tax=Adineta steineri TaxID=433720 RepID=A0A814T9M6_9BILA|nr:unnamed protein product [Adineta steineri]CAF3952494.1 unnamed protein product [Adineta steineri]